MSTYYEFYAAVEKDGKIEAIGPYVRKDGEYRLTPILSRSRSFIQWDEFECWDLAIEKMAEDQVEFFTDTGWVSDERRSIAYFISYKDIAALADDGLVQGYVTLEELDIGTGSLLGVSGYRDNPVSIPVGYETIIEMTPLDFEEFVWANGVSEIIIQELKQCMEQERPVPEPIHNRMKDLLLQYIVVGGMPEVVQTFVDTRQMNKVLRLQRDIIGSYEDDMIKNASRADKARIRECFRSIPKQLAKENKKFQYSVIKKGSTAASFAGCLQWIEDAGIIARCYNLTITELPLDGNAIQEIFKVYMRDTGLFISMLEDGTQADVLQGNLYAYKGAIFESLMADFLTKAGQKLYYYHKDSGLEIDFVTRHESRCTIVEVKAKSGNAKSMKTI